jgi:Ca2+-binding RTX toxin-like protein
VAEAEEDLGSIPQPTTKSLGFPGLFAANLFTERFRLADGAFKSAGKTEEVQIPKGGSMKVKAIVLGLAAIAALALVAVAAADRIKGTPGNDVLTGTERHDLIAGLAGDDQISGLGRGDILFGNRGNDTIAGGDGIDVIIGGPDNDNLDGGNSLDIVRGRSGDDTVAGGNGRDLLFGGRGVDSLSGGDGNDRLHAVARDGQMDTLDCGAGNHDVAVVREGEPLTISNCERVKTVPASAGALGEPGEPGDGS